jgi:hypothetical protein
MLELIKKRCGIAEAITIYDEDIKLYIDDCKDDMKASGVPENVIEAEAAGVITAVTFYVKANIGNDRTDTNRYMDLYRKKVFRLTMEVETDVES